MNKIVDGTLFRPFCWMVMPCWCRFSSPQWNIFKYSSFFSFYVSPWALPMAHCVTISTNIFFISRYQDVVIAANTCTRHTQARVGYNFTALAYLLSLQVKCIWKFYILFTIDNEKRSFRATSTCEHVTCHRRWTSYFILFFSRIFYIFTIWFAVENVEEKKKTRGWKEERKFILSLDLC